MVVENGLFSEYIEISQSLYDFPFLVVKLEKKGFSYCFNGSNL